MGRGKFIEAESRFRHIGCPKEIQETTPQITQITRDDGFRTYRLGDIEFPSVTTVLGQDGDKKAGIAAWRDRVGEEAADKVLTTAGQHGTLVHKLVEDYLNNEAVETKNIFAWSAFSGIKKILDKHVDNIVAQETKLFSKFLGVAGATDLIADFDKVRSVVDFKTSRSDKQSEDIHSYFQQGSAYAVSWEEMTKQPISQIVIIMAVDGAPPRYWIEKRDNHIQDFISARKRFRDEFGF